MKTIDLTQGKFALVDDDDFDRVNQFNWRAVCTGGHVHYVRRRFKTTNGKWNGQQYLHRFILPGVVEIDHINRDGLDNQKHNLRSTTSSQNHANQKKQAGRSSSFKGVYRFRRREWRASIQLNGKSTHLGLFKTEVDAAKAYDVAARKFFEEFARLNFSVDNGNKKDESEGDE